VKSISHINNNASGTATIISYQNKALTLLTCAHVIDFKDTLYTFYTLADGKPSKYLQSITIKEKQSNYIADLPGNNEFEIISTDKSLDLAMLGTKFNTDIPLMIRNFPYMMGHAKELEWGDFVYIIGFPMGLKLLTKALVSSPNKDRNGGFLVDAVFNRGFSGGIILAIRDGVPNFELVGMIKSVPAEYDYLVTPPYDFDYSNYNPSIPYSGDLYVEKRLNIRYGVTMAIPVETIKAFLDKTGIIWN
jgi:hypothetical protein